MTGAANQILTNVFGTAAFFLLGAFSGAFGRRLGLSLLKEERAAVLRKAGWGDVLPAFLLGVFYAASGVLRGGLGPMVLRDWVLAFLLLILSVTDLRNREIPNGPVLFGIVLWLLWLAVGGLFDGLSVPAALVIGLGAAVTFSGILLLLALIMDRLMKKETLGGGDIKLIFMIMLHLGFFRGFLCIVLSLVSGLLVILTRKERRIPLAPSIAFGALASLLLGAFLMRCSSLPFIG